MRIDLLVQGDPLATGAPERALRFARAARAGGHRIGRIFFYKRAVSVANRFATDDSSLRARLREFAADGGCELAICISAASRRGVVDRDTLADGFNIVGLGQLIESIEAGNRLVSF